MYVLVSSKEVFSAHAEVVPAGQLRGGVGVGILRARGGSSDTLTVLMFTPVYSPRTRR